MAGDENLQQLMQQPDGIGRLWQAINEPALQTASPRRGKARESSPLPISGRHAAVYAGVCGRVPVDATLGRAWAERHRNAIGRYARTLGRCGDARSIA